MKKTLYKALWINGHFISQSAACFWHDFSIAFPIGPKNTTCDKQVIFLAGAYWPVDGNSIFFGQAHPTRFIFSSSMPSLPPLFSLQTLIVLSSEQVTICRQSTGPI